MLQELGLRIHLHAVAEAAKVPTLYVPAVLVRAVSSHGGLFEELLGTMSTDEPLKAVAADVTAVFADGNFRVEDVLAHPAHPGEAACHGGRRLDGVLLDLGSAGRGRGGFAAGGGFGLEIVRHFLLCDVGVSSVNVGHMRQDVFESRHFNVALPAEVQEVGEVRSAMEAAHVKAGDGRLSHEFAAHATQVENLVHGQKMLGGHTLLRELQAALAEPRGLRGSATAGMHTWSQPPLLDRILTPILLLPGSFLKGTPLLLLCSMEPAVLKKSLYHRLIDLNVMLRRFCVLLHLSFGEKDFRADGALSLYQELLHDFHYRFLCLGHGAALPAVHTGKEKNRGN